MTTPPTDRKNGAQRLLRRLAARPPGEPVTRRPIGRVFLALWAAFAALFAFSAFSSWGQGPLLADLYAACFALGFGVLPMLVALAYRLRPTLGDLLTLVDLLVICTGSVLLVAHAWLSGQRAQFWSFVLVFSVLAVLYAAAVIWQPPASPRRPRSEG